MRIADIWRQGLDTALDAYPKIVAALVEQAIDGSCPHAKLVFELLDRKLSKAGEEEVDDETPSLAEYLLERLQIAPPDGADTTERPRV